MKEVPREILDALEKFARDEMAAGKTHELIDLGFIRAGRGKFVLTSLGKQALNHLPDQARLPVVPSVRSLGECLKPGKPRRTQRDLKGLHIPDPHTGR